MASLIEYDEPKRRMVIELDHGIWPFAWTQRYRGWCTVWYCIETGQRAWTFTEGRLADAAAAFRERKEGA